MDIPVRTEVNELINPMEAHVVWLVRVCILVDMCYRVITENKKLKKFQIHGERRKTLLQRDLTDVQQRAQVISSIFLNHTIVLLTYM